MFRNVLPWVKQVGTCQSWPELSKDEREGLYGEVICFICPAAKNWEEVGKLGGRYVLLFCLSVSPERTPVAGFSISGKLSRNK